MRIKDHHHSVEIGPFELPELHGEPESQVLWDPRAMAYRLFVRWTSDRPLKDEEKHKLLLQMGLK